MNIQHSTPMTPLRARMIADMTARNLGPASQVGHLRACKRFAAWLGRSPETAEPDDVRDFQQHLMRDLSAISGLKGRFGRAFGLVDTHSNRLVKPRSFGFG